MLYVLTVLQLALHFQLAGMHAWGIVGSLQYTRLLAVLGLCLPTPWFVVTPIWIIPKQCRNQRFVELITTTPHSPLHTPGTGTEVVCTSTGTGTEVVCTSTGTGTEVVCASPGTGTEVVCTSPGTGTEVVCASPGTGTEVVCTSPGTGTEVVCASPGTGTEVVCASPGTGTEVVCTSCANSLFFLPAFVSSLSHDNLVD